jgi:hypothetical protein
MGQVLHGSATTTEASLAGVIRLQRYCEPLLDPMRPGPSLAGVRLVIPDRAMGLPVLRALSLCTCCRHYPGAATGRRLRSSRPAVSAFPENVVSAGGQNRVKALFALVLLAHRTNKVRVREFR